jgi:hypothetical protein
VLRFDSGFLDEANFALCDELGIGFIATGKVFAAIKQQVAAIAEKLFLPIYLEWESDRFAETLWFDIWIPIICLRFDCESAQLVPGKSIQRMSAEVQLARNAEDQSDVTLSTHRIVVGAATHALVLEGWQVKSSNRDALNEFSGLYPAHRLIDNFFGAIRTVIGAETGYSQLVIVPRSWGHGWKAFLPYIHVASTRAYPEDLENFGWLRRSPILDTKALFEVSTVFEALNDLQNNSLSIAVKRLNAAQLRKDEGDSILDVTIGLEALLGDESKTEMTHKLAMRMAALSKIEAFAGSTPPQVFRQVKRVYNYRSALVHGSKSIGKAKQLIEGKGSEEVPFVELGLRLLRHAIRALTKYPEFLDPAKLDNYLLSPGNP